MLSTILQVILAIGFIMFGLSKFGSKQMVDEFKRYRLPSGFRVFTGLVEVIAAGFMIAGIWNDTFAAIGGILIIGTMLGAILTHLVRVKDPFSKAIMPIFLLVLGLIVLTLNFSALGL
ncbi:DoxX family protein [Gottfriedia solisilvae]|uniref:DoxX family protein n=1 Tax=Gottfriedia solisilvae TaxID=1516104 RepID=A0A8J3F0D4_9BACI|nr:DoxX family protein [Gottfriedia solisilvae]GGI17855.1 hypothetical protein GCM10007380_40020 [Gottfriedia solisilvae]